MIPVVRVELPALPYDAWEPTKTTLHLWAQVVGKIRLALAPPRNHWWHVTLHLDVRGITTGPLPAGGRTLSIDFDLIDHRLRVRTSDGAEDGFALEDGLSVAAFTERLLGILAAHGIEPELEERPFGVPMTTPFREDTEHAAYDADAVERWWRAVEWMHGPFQEFAGWFCGKASPFHLFWHSFDLALARYSGRSGPPMPDADPVTQEAYSHEVIAAGFWAGDAQNRFPGFYSYTAPEPEGLAERPLRPDEAQWVDTGNGHLAVLPYDVVRGADDPRDVLLGFLQSAYEAGADAAGWDRDGLTSSWCPGPATLAALGAPA
jgi:hypothetical protein